MAELFRVKHQKPGQVVTNSGQTAAHDHSAYSGTQLTNASQDDPSYGPPVQATRPVYAAPGQAQKPNYSAPVSGAPRQFSDFTSADDAGMNEYEFQLAGLARTGTPFAQNAVALDPHAARETINFIAASTKSDITQLALLNHPDLSDDAVRAFAGSRSVAVSYAAKARMAAAVPPSTRVRMARALRDLIWGKRQHAFA